MTEDSQSQETQLGIDENLEAVLAYVLGWISGLVFLFIEKDNDFVRFHAMQSLITFLGLFIIMFVMGMIPIIGWLISILAMPVSLVLWIFLMYKAYQGERYKLPMIGDLAEENMNQI